MLSKFFYYIKSLISIIRLNFSNDDSCILFYHPSKNLTNITTYYIENAFKKTSNKFKILYGYQNKNLKLQEYSNYFFLIQSHLKYLNNLKYFISTYLCDVFPKNAMKIYIHHDIYDTPVVDNSKLSTLKDRLNKYDKILVPNRISKKNFENILGKYKKKDILEIGYIKLDILNHLKKNYKKRKKNKKNIIIAPTNIYSFKGFSLIGSLENIIQKILKNTNLHIIVRPHPSNREDQMFKGILDKYRNNQRILFDISENYSQIYLNSEFMITDISGTAYTYAFFTKKPVLFYIDNKKIIEKNNFKKLSFFKDVKKIGDYVNNKNLIDKIKKIPTDKNKSIKKLLLKRIPYINKSLKNLEIILK